MTLGEWECICIQIRYKNPTMSRIMHWALDFEANLKYVFDSGTAMNVFVLIMTASPNWEVKVVFIERKDFIWKCSSTWCIKSHYLCINNCVIWMKCCLHVLLNLPQQLIKPRLQLIRIECQLFELPKEGSSCKLPEQNCKSHLINTSLCC